MITAKRIYGYGYWSLSNAIMDSAELESMNVYIYGYYTGYGSTVICRGEARCLLNCRGMYMCFTYTFTLHSMYCSL